MKSSASGSRTPRFAGLALGLGVLLLSACGLGDGPEAQLVGVYAIKQNGTLEEAVKIERQGTRYIARNKLRNASWSEPRMLLEPVSRDRWRRLTTDTSNTPFVGVAGERLGVFKVPVGWKKNDFSTGSGYVLFMSQGPVEAWKQ